MSRDWVFKMMNLMSRMQYSEGRADGIVVTGQAYRRLARREINTCLERYVVLYLGRSKRCCYILETLRS